MGRKKIGEADLKKLWGRAAGRCALCGNDLLPLLGSQPDVIGEMAHVIGYKKALASLFPRPRVVETTNQQVAEWYNSRKIALQNGVK